MPNDEQYRSGLQPLRECPQRDLCPVQNASRAILLPMQIDPVLEWQRLTAEYRDKGEGELLELARDFTDLTPNAQQALRAEMRSRGMGDPESPRTPPEVEVSQPSSSPSRPADSIAEPAPEVLSDQAGRLTWPQLGNAAARSRPARIRERRRRSARVHVEDTTL